jgi:general stress protein YciG
MAGNKTGGSITALKLKERDPDYYRKIGALGGKKGTTGGFAYAKLHYSEDDPRHPSSSGSKGGAISRRGSSASR